MSLRFASLASGSRGNALLVESGDTLLMIDCGVARKTLEQGFETLGRSPRDLSAVLITHEHGDHVQGIGPFLRRYCKPVWSTTGTAAAVGELRHAKRLNGHRSFRIGAIEIEPFPVPHDAREPCQFVLIAGKRRLGVLSDTGHVTRHIEERLAGCDALAVEFNHDIEMLNGGRYPEAVKARVASKIGHLNNGQARQLVKHISHPGLQWLAALHISQQNNTHDLARVSAAEAIDGSNCALYLAEQDRPSEWLEIE